MWYVGILRATGERLPKVLESQRHWDLTVCVCVVGAIGGP